MRGFRGGDRLRGVRRHPDGPTLCLEIVVNRWNFRIFDQWGRWGGSGRETDSVGIRRNPDGLEIVVNPWSLRRSGEWGGSGVETTLSESAELQTIRHSASKSSQRNQRGAGGHRRPTVRHSARNYEVFVNRNLEVGDRGGSLYFVLPKAQVTQVAQES